MATTMTTHHTLDLAFDHYNRYPGEELRIFVRFFAQAPISTLQVQLPKVLEIDSTVLVGMEEPGFAVAELDGDVQLTLTPSVPFSEGQEYHLEITTRVNSFYLDHYLIVQVWLKDEKMDPFAQQSGRVAVHGKSSYLRYLPEIYESDEFMSRFLMLFESFWKPMNNQIEQIQHIFDPELTPVEFMPWLSSWLGRSFDDLLPSERIRTLMKNTMMFYQQRGTVQALKLYLEIYTGGEVDIEERRASNFRLQAGNVLGLESALGQNTLPNAVRIVLKVSQDELSRTQLSASKYQNRVTRVVRSMVPAHVLFQVSCEFH